MKNQKNGHKQNILERWQQGRATGLRLALQEVLDANDNFKLKKYGSLNPWGNNPRNEKKNGDTAKKGRNACRNGLL